MSKLINLDQVRAANALAASEVKKSDNEGDNLSGYPSLVINNGLIATIAFSVDKGKQHERIAFAIATHLAQRGIILSNSAIGLRDALCAVSSSVLKRATAETLAFLAYLKRFHRS
ncbi:MAG: CRISPR/Cas system CMR-associated protein Cmr5 small subunit [Akkermansiaceae bacterium]|jgi:CRISPR/Cas system CMR-associated protein Cmr5 small subunit